MNAVSKSVNFNAEHCAAAWRLRYKLLASGAFSVLVVIEDSLALIPTRLSSCPMLQERLALNKEDCNLLKNLFPSDDVLNLILDELF